MLFNLYRYSLVFSYLCKDYTYSPCGGLMIPSPALLTNSASKSLEHKMKNLNVCGPTLLPIMLRPTPIKITKLNFFAFFHKKREKDVADRVTLFHGLRFTANQRIPPDTCFFHILNIRSPGVLQRWSHEICTCSPLFLLCLPFGAHKTNHSAHHSLDNNE